MSETQELRANQRKAIEKLAAGYAVSVASSAAGVTDRTVYLWLKEEPFKSALSEANSKLFEASIRRMTAAAHDAVRVLHHIVNDTTATNSERIRASDSLLSHLGKYREMHMIEERLSQLERLLSNANR